MEGIDKIANQLEKEAETFRNLAAGAAASNEVRLPPSTVEGLAKRFAQMSESLRKIAEQLKVKPKI
jgi:uncharacterized protein YukE